jgi:uncharacterized surface anchored protein
MRSVSRFFASGLVLVFLFATVAFSQASQTGGITGVVTDQSGAVVKGATVDIIDVATAKSARTVTTDDEGRFGANLLSPGAYRLEVTAANFKKAVV